MNRLHREPIFRGTRPLGVTLAALDLDLIRRLFRDLFDEAARAVQLAGYEQDDSIVERFATCRIAHGPAHTIPINALADPEHLTHNVIAALARATGTAPDPAAVEITDLHVEAIVERW